MGWIGRLARRCQALCRKAALEREMDEEMHQHIELEAEQLARTLGLEPEEAWRRARVAFGAIERFKEEGRDARGTRPLEDSLRDLRYSARGLRRRPGYALAAVLTLGVGFGAVAAIFTLVNAILLRPLPYPDADRLVAVKHTAPGLGLETTGLSSGTYLHYRAHATTLEAVAIYHERTDNYADDHGDVERVRIAMAGPELFEVLGIRPVLGRLYTADEWAPVVADPRMEDHGQRIPILLSHDFWRRRYGGHSDVIGRIVRIRGQPREIVGVLPPTLAVPQPTTQVWMLSMPGFLANFARSLEGGAVGRLRPGVSAAAAEAELRNLLPSIEGVYADATAERMAEVQLAPIVVPLKQELVGGASTALWILFGGMTFLLLVATSNVVNLFLLRLEHRRREMAIRRALGARRLEVYRLWFGESLLLCVAGATLALAIASWALGMLPLLPIELPRMDEVRLDASTVAFTTTSALALALLLTFVATVRHARDRIDRGSLVSTTAASSRGARRLREVLVAAQVALTLLLLAGAGLTARSFHRIVQVERGFDARNLLTVEVGIPVSRWRQVEHIYGEILERTRALPGVDLVAAVTSAPLAGGTGTSGVRSAEPGARAGATDPAVFVRYFAPGYFRTMGTPVLEGHTFDSDVPTGADNPVVVSAALARRLFPGQTAVGKRLHLLEIDGSLSAIRSPLTIAGVAADVREASLRAEAAEILYVPVLQPRVETGVAPMSTTLVVRTQVPPLALGPAIREVLRDYDGEISVGQIRTMESIVAASTARESVLAALLVIAGVTALFIGAVGVYGVASYAVQRRTAEIGIRMALGARSISIIALVLRESSAAMLSGLAVGLAGALAGGRLMRSLLFEVAPGDPIAIGLALAVLTLVALAAVLLAARRAVRLDPTVALRSE